MEKQESEKPLSNFPTATTTTKYTQLWDTDLRGKAKIALKIMDQGIQIFPQNTNPPKKPPKNYPFFIFLLSAVFVFIKTPNISFIQTHLNFFSPYKNPPLGILTPAGFQKAKPIPRLFGKPSTTASRSSRNRRWSAGLGGAYQRSLA